MAGNNIDVEVKDRLLTIQVRNMIRMDSKAKDVLEIQPLPFKLEVLLALSDNGAQAPLKKQAFDELRKGVEGLVAKAQDLINDEVKDLGEEIGKQRKKDESGDKGAYRNAVKQVSGVVDRIDDITDGLPPSVREETKKVIKQKKYEGIFAKQKLTSVGSWGFHGDKGIRVRPGTFKHVAKDDEVDKELWEALKSTTPQQFVFVDGRKGGLVVSKSITAADKQKAKEQSGGGTPITGTMEKKSDVYHFELDKECTESKAEKLATKIRTTIKERCNKKIKVKVSDDDQDLDDDADAKDGAAASVKKS